MQCTQCHSDNVQISMIQEAGRVRHTGVGIAGHTNNAARGLMAVSTLGMSNLVWKKSKGGSSQKFKNRKMCVCQDFGHSWRIK